MTLRAALLLTASVLVPAQAQAGAWTQPKGVAYVKVAGAGLETRSRFDRDGRRIGLDGDAGASTSGEYRSRELRAYAEYGAARTLTLYGSFAYKDLATDQAMSVLETNGGSDLVLGAKARLRGGAVPISVSGEVKIPTGYEVGEQPALGNGERDYTVRLLTGTSFGRAYVTGDVGFSHRTGRYRDELLYSGEAGSRVAGPLYARTVLRGVRALGDPGDEPQGAVFDPGLTSPRMLLLDGALGLDLGDGVGMEASLSHVLSGREALAGNTVEVALVMLLGGRAPR